MKPKDVRDRIRKIAEENCSPYINTKTGELVQSWNDHSAHSDEADLRNDVLVAIATGAKDPELLALEVLKTDYLDFYRWYS